MPRRVDLSLEPASLETEATIRASAMTGLMTLVQYWTSADFQALLAARAHVGVESRDVPALFLLGLNGPMRPSELATALRVSAGNVSKIADRLSRAGFAARTAVEGDARASMLALTTSGAAASRALFEEGERILAEILADWAAPDVKQFSVSLMRLVDRVTESVGRDAL